MSRFIYDIVDSPEGEIYSQLLAMASEVCDSFILVTTPTLGLHKSGRDLIAALESSLIHLSEEAEWPGTKLFETTATVHRFRITPASIERLEKAARGLYEWVQPDLPEDPCFLRKDESPWLVTIAHEKDAYMELSPEEKAQVSKRIPNLRLVAHRKPSGGPGVP